MILSISQRRAEKELNKKGYIEVQEGIDKLFTNLNQYTVVHKNISGIEVNRYHTEANCPTMAINRYSCEVLIGKMNDGDSLQVLYGCV
jgi:hypothetical protein